MNVPCVLSSWGVAPSSYECKGSCLCYVLRLAEYRQGKGRASIALWDSPLCLAFSALGFLAVPGDEETGLYLLS